VIDVHPSRRRRAPGHAAFVDNASANRSMCARVAQRWPPTHRAEQPTRSRYSSDARRATPRDSVNKRRRPQHDLIKQRPAPVHAVRTTADDRPASRSEPVVSCACVSSVRHHCVRQRRHAAPSGAASAARSRRRAQIKPAAQCRAAVECETPSTIVPSLQMTTETPDQCKRTMSVSNACAVRGRCVVEPLARKR